MQLFLSLMPNLLLVSNNRNKFGKCDISRHSFERCKMLDLGQCFVTFNSAARDVQVLQVNIKIVKRKIGRIYNWVGWFCSVFHFLFVYKFDVKGSATSY